MTRRIFLDTEWTKPPWSKQSELMWIGLADEEGRSWYGISSEVDIDPSTNDFISDVFRLITPDELRLTILNTGTNCGFKLQLFGGLVRLANDDPTSTYARDFERNSLSSL